MRNSKALLSCALGLLACSGGSNSPSTGGAGASSSALGGGGPGGTASSGGSAGTSVGGASLGGSSNGGLAGIAGNAGLATGGEPASGASGLGGSAGSGGATGGAGGSSAGAGGSSGGAGGSSAGAGGAPAPLPPLKITSDTASIEFTPLLVAAESFYSGTASVGSGGIVTLLNDSSVDLGSNAETQSLRQSVDHPNLRIVFTVTETFYRIVASRSAGVSKLADLKSKSIATIPNTSAAYYVDKMMRTVGLTDKDVTIRSASAETLPTLLANGTVAAVTLWEPSPQVAMDRIGSDAIEFQDRAVYREIVNLHSTAETLAKPEKRRGIVAFVRSLIEAQRQFREQPEKAKPRVSKALSMDAALLDKVWHNEQWLGTLVPDILDILVEEDVWVAAQTGRTARTRTQLAPLVDDSIMKEALAGQ
ncbi:MAG: ABC transporter substrate-binding protein [Pseudomonadota bacterium]